MTETRYDLHGIPLLVVANDDRLASSVDRRLRQFRGDGAGGMGVDPFTVDVACGVGSAYPARQEDGRPVYDTPAGPLLYHELSDRLSLDYGGKAGLLAEFGTRRVRLWATSDDDESVWLLSHPLLTLALAELLKRERRYPLHAAAMSPRPGEAVLLAGGSGAGKTTLALGLLRSGWGFLADDTVFLQPRADGVSVFGFADEIDVSSETLEMFPEVARTATAPPVPGRAKRPVLVEDLTEVPPLDHCDAVALVFPAVASRRASSLSPVDPGEALAELAPNVLLTDRCWSQRHFDALALLAASVPCWRLATGTDFAEVSDQLRELVPERGSSCVR